MNTQHKINDASSPHMSSPRLLLRRGSQAALGTGAVVLVAGVGWLAGGSAESAPATKTAAPSASEYHASEFAGVQVRSIPQAAKQTGGKNAGWIYVKPGAPLPQSPPGPMTRGGGVARIVAGRSRAGGKALYLPESRMPLASAQKSRSGVVLKCDHDGKPHSAAEHARHSQSTRALQTQKSSHR